MMQKQEEYETNGQAEQEEHREEESMENRGKCENNLYLHVEV